MPTVKGAFVRYEDSLLGALPNIIVFQFNPETMTRNPSIYSEDGSCCDNAGKKEKLNITGMPSESLSFTLRLDAGDKIAKGDPLAINCGILPALSALELLMYPRNKVDLNSNQSGEYRNSPEKLPVILFIWGVQRVLPVKINSLSINEMEYDTRLNPTRAEVSVSMEVITPPDLSGVAERAYSYTLNAKKAMAAANYLSEAQDWVI